MELWTCRCATMNHVSHRRCQGCERARGKVPDVPRETPRHLQLTGAAVR